MDTQDLLIEAAAIDDAIAAAKEPRRPLSVRLREWCIARALRQCDVAKAMGLTSVGHISEIESGNRHLTRENIERLIAPGL